MKTQLLDLIIRMVALQLTDPNNSHPKAQEILLFLFELKDATDPEQ